MTCRVGIYTAASTSDRIAFHTINRVTGNRVNQVFVDSATGAPVDRDDQVKGYEVGEGDYVLLDPDEVAAAVPESDKTLSVSSFISFGLHNLTRQSKFVHATAFAYCKIIRYFY